MFGSITQNYFLAFGVSIGQETDKLSFGLILIKHRDFERVSAIGLRHWVFVFFFLGLRPRYENFWELVSTIGPRHWVLVKD